MWFKELGEIRVGEIQLTPVIGGGQSGRLHFKASDYIQLTVYPTSMIVVLKCRRGNCCDTFEGNLTLEEFEQLILLSKVHEEKYNGYFEAETSRDMSVSY